MKKISLLLIPLFLAGCFSATKPEMIPDQTTDSVIMLKLKHEIMNGDKISQNWGWILWYLPVLFLVVAWAWKEFISKRCADEEHDAEKDETKPQTTEASSTDTPQS